MFDPGRKTYHMISKKLNNFESEYPEAPLTTLKWQSASLEANTVWLEV